MRDIFSLLARFKSTLKFRAPRLLTLSFQLISCYEFHNSFAKNDNLESGNIGSTWQRNQSRSTYQKVMKDLKHRDA
jgi:hypothetical protein